MKTLLVIACIALISLIGMSTIAADFEPDLAVHRSNREIQMTVQTNQTDNLFATLLKNYSNTTYGVVGAASLLLLMASRRMGSPFEA